MPMIPDDPDGGEARVQGGDLLPAVDVVLGELGEMTRIAAHSAQLVLHFPECASFRQLTAFREEDGGHYIKLRIGDLPAGRTRRIAFLFDISEHIFVRENNSFRLTLGA